MKRKILQIILGSISKRIIRKYKPKIIAITGSAGKTTAKDAVAFFLENKFGIRKSVGNLNSEWGLPLVFIGVDKGGGDSFFAWLSIIFKGVFLIIKKREYPEIIVAEMGADKPGDISYLVKIAKPQIGIITWIGEIPVHVEAYKDVESVALEKSQIIQCLKEEDVGILNFDDEKIREISKKSKARSISFGFENGADVLLSGLRNEVIQEKAFFRPFGMSFKINYEGRGYDIHLPHCIGKPFAYAVGAAFCCALALKVSVDRFADFLLEFRPQRGRMNMIRGIDNSFILDDTYNSSPSALKLALSTLKELRSLRKIAILGDMKELGKYSEKAHSEIGEKVLFCDLLITLGSQARIISENANKNGMGIEKIFHYKNLGDAISKVKEIVQPGDLFLIKGSRSMEMDKIVNALRLNRNGA